MNARSKYARQTTPLVLVVVGLIACALAERFGYRDLVTIAVATNAAGLTLLTQHHVLPGNNNELSQAGSPKSEAGMVSGQ